jgi:transcriptional regulator with XRE-family HTH domain
MPVRPPVEPEWWTSGSIDGVAMPDALAGRDIGAVFRFLHQRGWSWAAIAQATDIGEQRVREIANGKRRVENYDVYVRVAVGLNIPRGYLGVGLRLADGDGTLTGAVTAPAAPARLTAALRATLELATPAKADGGDPPDLGQFEELVMQA